MVPTPGGVWLPPHAAHTIEPVSVTTPPLACTLIASAGRSDAPCSAASTRACSAASGEFWAAAEKVHALSAGPRHAINASHPVNALALTG